MEENRDAGEGRRRGAGLPSPPLPPKGGLQLVHVISSDIYIYIYIVVTSVEVELNTCVE